MTPHRKQTLRRLATWASPLIIAAVLGAARYGAHQVVTRTDLAAHTDSERQALTAVNHRLDLDSLRHDANDARIDTALAQLVRACQHRGECP